MAEVYLLSGLGADKRVFDWLDFSGNNVTHVIWLEPVSNESLEQYARRLLNQITATQPVLVGVSFGGIMAIEIAKLIETKKIVLISSARTRSDLPFYYK